MRPSRRLQRTIAIRVVAAYKTVSFDAATLLARMPPWPLDASMRCCIYDRIKERKRLGDYSIADSEIRLEETLLLYRQWNILLNRPGGWGQRTINAIGPYLVPWLNRKFGKLSFHSTQLLTGHGSFGHFLWRIDRRTTSNCYHCACIDDTSEHTLAECSAWVDLRTKMCVEIKFSRSENLNLGKIIGKMLEKKEYWTSFINFATLVIKSKEEEERLREKASPSSPV